MYPSPLLLQSTPSEVSAAVSEFSPMLSTIVMSAAFVAMVAVLTAFIRIVRRNNSPFK